MAKFRYTARNELGEIQAGFVEAVNRDLAIKILQDNKLFILSLESVEKKNIFEQFLFFFQRVKRKDLMIFTRQLSALLSAKVSLSESLKSLAHQVTNPILKDVLSEVVADVEGGIYLSQALAKHPQVFSDFYINMIRSAELAGRLEETFLFLADYLERENRLINRARNAMIYPLFVIAVFIGVLILMLVVVMPQLKAIFEEVNMKLPLLTRILLGLGEIFKNWGWIFLIFLFFISILFIRYLKTKEGKLIWDEVVLYLPILGSLTKKMCIARFASAVQVLIKGGLPVADSLEIAARIVGNYFYQEILNKTAQGIRKGATISGVLSEYPNFFPFLVLQMIAVGESTGQLEELLEKVYAFYNEEVETILSNLVELIQPALIIALGIFIGLFIAAVLIPIYNLAQAF